MWLSAKLKQLLTKTRSAAIPSADEVEICIFGLNTKMTRKTLLPVPHELSVYIPRLELTKKITEGNKITETSIVLNSLTIVSAPRHEPTGHPAEVSSQN